MDKKNMETKYASPERISKESILKVFEKLNRVPLVKDIIDKTTEIMFVLNKDRQIVFTNRAFMKTLGSENYEDVIGKRPGEALGCVHSENVSGCGTTEYCIKCGAVNSILETIKTDEDSEAECLLSVKGGESIELFVVTKPFSYEGDKFVFFTAKDISGVKRKNALEKIFFHDLMNLASSVYSVIDLIKESGTEDMSEDMLGLLHKTCENMIKEINDYRILSLAEKEELSVSLQRVPVARFIKEVISLYSTMASQKNIEIIFKSETDDSFYTDVSLSGRVLGNMLKNAIEASKKSENISVWTENTEEGTMLHVQNKSIIPEDIKTQIFKRTFTTKMTGTGLGTYSMKLIMQKYLKGDISFVSQEGLGTIFSAKFPSKETYMSQK
jgi:hypothetical protein